jgi:hypothetical protein
MGYVADTLRFLINLTRLRHCASRVPERSLLRSACEYCRWLSMPITFAMKESSDLCSQITGDVENAVPLHANIPRTGGWDFDLPSEYALQEYLKFPYEYCLSVLLLFEGYCCKLCPSNNLRRKSLAPISSNFSVSTRRLCFFFLVY